MNRRTLLKSLGLGLCAAMLGLWPDLGGQAEDDLLFPNPVRRCGYYVTTCGSGGWTWEHFDADGNLLGEGKHARDEICARRCKLDLIWSAT